MSIRDRPGVITTSGPASGAGSDEKPPNHEDDACALDVMWRLSSAYSSAERWDDVLTIEERFLNIVKEKYGENTANAAGSMTHPRPRACPQAPHPGLGTQDLGPLFGIGSRQQFTISHCLVSSTPNWVARESVVPVLLKILKWIWFA